MKKILIYIFSETTDKGFALSELECQLPNQKKHIKNTIALLIKHKLIAKKNEKNTIKYILLNHNPDILYQLLNINYEIEQYIEINSPSNAKKDYLYAYYYATYKELAYYNETAVYPIKIGYTTNNYPLLRIQEQLGTATPENPIIAYLIKIENAKKLEATIHNYLKMKNKHIDNTPNKEWFNTNTTELKEIIEMLTT